MITYKFSPYNIGYILGNAVVIGLLLFIVLFFIIYLIAKCRLFKKAGLNGWLAIVPFYSDYLFTVKICGLHWAWYLGALLSGILVATAGSAGLLIRVFVKAMSFYNLALKCRRDPIPSMIFGALFPEVVTMVFGFSQNPYDDLVEVKKSGVF